MSRVAVIIVNYNAGEMLHQCLAALEAQSVRPARVLVMDNGVYEVTGAQPVPARVDFGGLARSGGIPNVHHFTTGRAWETAALDVLATRGPNVVILDIEPVPGRPAPKSPGNAAARAAAFRAALAE